MFCFACCKRFFEPVRDVSFITNADERILIQDFINACNMARAWPSIRRGTVDQTLVSEIQDALTYKHDFELMIQLMEHMATDWESWVINRKLVQEKEESEAASIDQWVSKYKWNSNANNVLLLAYMENLLTLSETFENGKVDKILFQLEVALARKRPQEMNAYKNFLQHVEGDGLEAFKESIEYKMEICKIVTEIPLPTTYKFTKQRWDKNKKYIESCESIKKILADLQSATLTKNLDELIKAIDFSDNFPSVKDTQIYNQAVNMLSIISDAATAATADATSVAT
jgi:hypothetical protein